MTVCKVYKSEPMLYVFGTLYLNLRSKQHTNSFSSF